MIASHFPELKTLGKRWISCIAFLFISHGIWGQTQTFTVSGTFTVPAGVTSINVQCWGAGGAGGGSSANNSGGSGGGGGGYTSASLTVAPNQSIPFTVGIASRLIKRRSIPSFFFRLAHCCRCSPRYLYEHLS